MSISSSITTKARLASKFACTTHRTKTATVVTIAAQTRLEGSRPSPPGASSGWRGRSPSRARRERPDEHADSDARLVSLPGRHAAASSSVRRVPAAVSAAAGTTNSRSGAVTIQRTPAILPRPAPDRHRSVTVLRGRAMIVAVRRRSARARMTAGRRIRWTRADDDSAWRPGLVQSRARRSTSPPMRMTGSWGVRRGLGRRGHHRRPGQAGGEGVPGQGCVVIRSSSCGPGACRRRRRWPDQGRTRARRWAVPARGAGAWALARSRCWRSWRSCC